MFAKLKNKLSLVFSKSWNFLRPRQKLGLVSFVLLSSLIISTWFIFTPVAHAGIIAGVLETIADIFFALAGFFIKLTFFVLKFIIEVAGYNGFIDSSAVIVGWVMVRDVTNMFFVVVLLIISFGTILGLERYEYKKLLVKLIMAAVIVNFSRIICGLIIDIAQVIMITFVNGIAATASGNLVNMFQVDQIFKLSQGSAAKSGSPGEIFLMGVAALTFSVMMLVTMLTFLFLLMARMAMLWVLIVLSPFAFVLNVLPQTEKYASQWWGEFGGHVVAGPIIAFFLWLSFVTVGSGSVHDEIVANNGLPAGTAIGSGSPEEESIGLGEIMSWEKMANFAIAIAMLLAGAKMAQQLGVVGGSAMGKAGELGKKVAMYASGVQAARWGAKKGLEGAKWTGKQALRGLYHGTNLVPGLHGIHPEQWKRRFGNVKNKFMTGYQERLNRKTSEAGAISKNFRVNEAGQYVKKVALLDNEGNIVKKDGKIQYEQEAVLDKDGFAKLDENGEVMKRDKEVVQSGAGDWIRRQSARFLLESMPGARGFMHEYSEDIKSTREATEKQMEHLASASQLPIGRKKLEAKQKLKELEETGAGIKIGKEARWEERRGDILDMIDGAKPGEDYHSKLREMGLDEGDIVDAENASKRRKRSVEEKARAKVTGELNSADQSRREAKAMDKYMKKGSGFDTGKEQEEKTAVIKAETKQVEDNLNTAKELEELQQIRKLLGTNKGAKLQSVITQTRAEIANVKEIAENKAEEAGLRARAADYLKNKEEEKSEASTRRADSLGLEKTREATKNLTGDELIARAAFLAERLVEAKKSGDEAKANEIGKKLFVARSSAMNQAAWVGPVVDRVLEKVVGITQEQKEKMTSQQYSLSLDLGEVCDSPDKVKKFAEDLEKRLGGDNNQAYLRDRRLAVESALEKSRHDVAGTMGTKFEKGRVKYIVVDSANEEVSDNEYKVWSKKVDLTTSAGAPISNRGRSNDGIILENAINTCKTEFEVMVSKLAGLTANQYSRIPKIIEDLQKSDEGFRKKLIGMLKTNKGTNEELLEKLASDLKVDIPT